MNQIINLGRNKKLRQIIKTNWFKCLDLKQLLCLYDLFHSNIMNLLLILQLQSTINLLTDIMLNEGCNLLSCMEQKFCHIDSSCKNHKKGLKAYYSPQNREVIVKKISLKIRNQSKNKKKYSSKVKSHLKKQNEYESNLKINNASKQNCRSNLSQSLKKHDESNLKALGMNRDKKDYLMHQKTINNKDFMRRQPPNTIITQYNKPNCFTFIYYPDKSTKPKKSSLQTSITDAPTCYSNTSIIPPNQKKQNKNILPKALKSFKTLISEKKEEESILSNSDNQNQQYSQVITGHRQFKSADQFNNTNVLSQLIAKIQL